jgi:outer membrane protein insertion porin family
MGQVATIGSISFEGNENLPSSQLKNRLRMSRIGSLYQPQRLNYELRNLENFYRDRGYLDVEIELPEVVFQSLQGNGKVAVIRIKIREGSQFMMGKLEIENAQVLQKNTLLQMAPLAQGKPYSRSTVRRWVDKIRDNYRSMGYMRFEAEIREDVHRFRDVVDLVLVFHEGAEYKVGRIQLADQKLINSAEFKRQLLIAEGSVFDPQMLSHTIHFLNMKRIYAPISRSDVEIRIDDAQNTVDLIFKITPRRKRNPS